LRGTEIDSLQGEDLEDYATRLANAWGVGRKGVEDGVVLLIFMKERRMRLAVGDGLRKAIPDTAASDILATIVAPRFRTGQHVLGLQEAADAIFQRIRARQRFKGEHELRGCGSASEVDPADTWKARRRTGAARQTGNES
jgi:uncharacterized protein